MITKNFFIDQWILILSFIIFIKSPFFKIDIYNPDIRLKKSVFAQRKLGDKSKAQISVYIFCLSFVSTSKQTIKAHLCCHVSRKQYEEKHKNEFNFL